MKKFLAKNWPVILLAVLMASCDLIPVPALAQNTATKNITIAAQAALSITSSQISCTVGQACSGNLLATGGMTPYTWTVSSGTVPSGFVLNADGSFAWTPSAVVAGSVVGFTVTDSAGHSVSLNWTPGSGGTAVAEFDIYRNLGGCSPLTDIGSVPASQKTYLDTKVSAGQTFCYGVTSKSAAGQESAMSNTTTVTVPTP